MLGIAGIVNRLHSLVSQRKTLIVASGIALVIVCVITSALSRPGEGRRRGMREANAGNAGIMM